MALRAYRPASYPQIEAGVSTYISNEYDKISQALASLTENLPPDLASDVATLQSDVATLQSDVAALQSDVTSIQAALAAATVSFSAHKNGTGQTLTSTASDQKVTFGTEAWDTGSFYNTSTSRWTPPAGLVQLVAQVFVGSVTDQIQYHISIYKNGSLLKVGNVLEASGSSLNVSPHVTVIDQANGTDFYEVFIAMSDGVAKNVSGTAAFTYFQGAVL